MIILPSSVLRAHRISAICVTATSPSLESSQPCHCTISILGDNYYMETVSGEKLTAHSMSQGE